MAGSTGSTRRRVSAIAIVRVSVLRFKMAVVQAVDVARLAATR